MSARVRDPVPFRLAKRLSITPENAEVLGRRLLAWARRYSADGYLPDDLHELAYCVEFDGPGDVLLAALVAEGVAEDSERGPRMAGWAADVERREKGAERVRRHREKVVTGQVTPDVTGQVTREVTATTPETRHVTAGVTPKKGDSSRAGAIPPPPPTTSIDQIPDLEDWLHAILQRRGFKNRQQLSPASIAELTDLLRSGIFDPDGLEALIVDADKAGARHMKYMRPAIDRAKERAWRVHAEETGGVLLQFPASGGPG